ncbi:MAG: M23 family metallopeptidase [Acidobacteria bacterium]|nr:M23 family metallopeptidase [Acidobacteriota bacterium]MCB9397930.1 M23 family metallopeptidase [Acidobacteriota bacterium]
MDRHDQAQRPAPRWRFWKWILLYFGLVCLGYSQSLIIPVQFAQRSDWNASSFWHAPWGSSGVHKGIDIFAQKGTPVLAPCSGWVLSRGNGPKSGLTVLMLGPNLRLHYMGHLDSIDPAARGWVRQGTVLGTVGNSGNAVGKPAHLHYAIVALIPHPWQIRLVSQGWKRMFFLDPNNWLPG